MYFESLSLQIFTRELRPEPIIPVSDLLNKFLMVPGFISWRESTEYDTSYYNRKYEAQVFPLINMSVTDYTKFHHIRYKT